MTTAEQQLFEVLNIKPLFIPLKTEFFNAFKYGTKTHEFRVGERWSAKHCNVGRAVTLSRGYGKQERLKGVITSFEVVNVDSLLGNDYNAVKALYPYTVHINKIGVEVLK